MASLILFLKAVVELSNVYHFGRIASDHYSDIDVSNNDGTCSQVLLDGVWI